MRSIGAWICDIRHAKGSSGHSQERIRASHDRESQDPGVPPTARACQDRRVAVASLEPLKAVPAKGGVVERLAETDA